MHEFIHLKVKLQDNPNASPRWEEFKVLYRPNMNVVSVLMEIQKNPVNAKGEKTPPVVWECNCLEEVCGACTMIINGKATQSCSALIDNLPAEVITLEPLSKFPVIRDLMVDRTKIFDHLKQVKAWIEVDGAYPIGRGPRMNEKDRRWAYEISKCMTCGCCYESCPNFNFKTKFIGPAPIAQVRRFNVHPLGAMNKADRLDRLMGDGGIADCGNAQNCVRACPKNIDLTTSIADMNQDTTVYSIKRFFRK
ncbi:MAG: succinate dehydrogenase iron-sulfur subunit [Clostridia bacterium]|jgi:succinate dehydrogenase / fumarate reductase iron-sulfur subunit|nr:succinate dehydrogenase iron-sulfur subunit [Clostridia bacterium]